MEQTEQTQATVQKAGKSSEICVSIGRRIPAVSVVQCIA